ncbi:hypothetical protein [Lentilactobacillus kisonensis]|uniref:Integral membrane protein n=1 Tax=Lentilactobacillus kisonensis DSM 19906 = JCM 15041 TaxID=1423766 RepID=A0A0R1NW30_9LACO|nr:hypothetical protein [Lentilactobacillus kisonensis]KRL22516.1 hypothetical protein FC98_GL002404 [Lentilactobacillus kisonensis DSM 19906 = JCM 15041]
MQSTAIKTSPRTADIGDYLKLFACTAVMLQTILNTTLTSIPKPPATIQVGIGMTYNLVKFTAPAFIFGILYTTLRTTAHPTPTYHQYLTTQWHALFVPTIWWTSIYLLVMPWVQQVTRYHSIGGFLWQFINGNAAPHLWYNTMMLQFIILMPLFWWLSRWCDTNTYRGFIVLLITTILYFGWLLLYDILVFHGPFMNTWYLLDRFFFSFIIYGVGGTLAWQYQHFLDKFGQRWWLLILVIAVASYYWINTELFQFTRPVSLTNAIYYKPSMAIYDIAIILLIATLGTYQLNRHLPVTRLVHYLATFAYKAFLSNVFWQQLLWLSFGKQLTAQHDVLGIITVYVGTWLLSFASAMTLHFLWRQMS